LKPGHDFVINPASPGLRGKFDVFTISAIHFLINLDLRGTGTDGLAVVNGNIYTEKYEQLLKLNESEKLLPALQKKVKHVIAIIVRSIKRRSLVSFFIC
jgi:hypothetical protein